MRSVSPSLPPPAKWPNRQKPWNGKRSKPDTGAISIITYQACYRSLQHFGSMARPPNSLRIDSRRGPHLKTPGLSCNASRASCAGNPLMCIPIPDVAVYN